MTQIIERVLPITLADAVANPNVLALMDVGDSSLAVFMRPAMPTGRIVPAGTVAGSLQEAVALNEQFYIGTDGDDFQVALNTSQIDWDECDATPGMGAVMFTGCAQPWFFNEDLPPRPTRPVGVAFGAANQSEGGSAPRIGNV